MSNIDDLKSDWKSLKKPASRAERNISPSALINDFEKIQHKTRLENIICSILFVLTIGIIWSMVYFMDDASWWVYSGVAILSVEMILVTGFAWYRNSLKKWGDLQHNSYRYLTSAIKKLKYRKFMTAYIIPVYSLLLITGINLIYIDVLSDMSATLRWLIHGGVSVLLGGYVIFEIRRRMKKQAAKIDPLIEELQAMKEGFE